MKVQEMLKRKMACADSFDNKDEGLDCHTCQLCDTAKLVTEVEEAQGSFLEGTEIKLVVNPCLLLDHLAGVIGAK